jgi:RNA polymerase sigma-70 factor (ECF subfamily)
MSTEPEPQNPPAERGDAQRIADQLGALRAYVHLRLGRALRAREESIDIAQSVVREALADAHRFEGGDEGLRAWLWRRAENKIRDRGRFWARQRRDSTKEIGQADDPDLAQAYGSLLTPSRVASGREEIARVERAFAELADDQRRVILLARVANLSHAEVAATMGRTELATRSLLSRAIARLSMLLEER